MKRVLLCVVVLGAVMQPVTATAQTGCLVTDEQSGITAYRYGGADRYATAVCVSQQTWAGHDEETPPERRANAVVLARGDDFPDAVAGGPLAGHVGAPLLLNPPTRLRSEVLAEIKRVLAPQGLIYLLGGTGSLSSGIESAFTSAGFTTKRLAGRDRFETAVAISRAMPTTGHYFFTTGMNFPDALAAGSAAAMINRSPDDSETWSVLFTRDSVMPAVTGARGSQTPGMYWTPVTVGGAADQAFVSRYRMSPAWRFIGSNRFDTAARIAHYFYGHLGEENDLKGEGVGLADGMSFPDALAGSAALAHVRSPLLLTRSTALPAETREFLAHFAGKVPGADGDRSTGALYVFGGTGAVPTPVMDAAVAAFTPAPTAAGSSR